MNSTRLHPSYPHPSHVQMIVTAVALLSSSSGPGAVSSVLHAMSLSLTTFVTTIGSGGAGTGHSSVYSKAQAPDCVCSFPVSLCGKHLFSGLCLLEILGGKGRRPLGTVQHQRKHWHCCLAGPHFQSQLSIYLPSCKSII